MADDAPLRSDRIKRTTGPMLRMVSPMTAPEAVVVGMRFDLGVTSGWESATADTWHGASDLETGHHIWLLQRPTRALGPAELRALEGLAQHHPHVAAPIASSRVGELPGWVAYACDEEEIAAEDFAESPMTIAEAVALGQGLCRAVMALGDAGLASPSLTPATIMMRRQPNAIDVRLLGVGLVWPVAPADESAKVQGIGAVVFQALTTRAPAPGHVPRLADARPELSSSGPLESVLRRALGTEAPPIASVVELHDAFGEVLVAQTRTRKGTSPGLPRPESALLSAAELGLAPPGDAAPAPAPAPSSREATTTRRSRGWLPIALLLLLGAGIAIALVASSADAPPAAPSSSPTASASEAPRAAVLPAPTPSTPTPGAPAVEPPAKAAGPVPAAVATASPAPSSMAPTPPEPTPPTPTPGPPEPTPSTPAPAPAPLAPAPAPPATPEPATFALLVTSAPSGARVARASGAELGTTPLELTLRADEFPLELRLSRPGYTAQSVTVQRPEAPEKEIAVALPKHRATPPRPRAVRTPPAPAPGEFIFER